MRRNIIDGIRPAHQKIYLETNETYTNMILNKGLISLTSKIIEDEDFNIMHENKIDISKIETTQALFRESMILNKDDITFKDNNKLSLTKQNELFILGLTAITDMKNINSFQELFDLYKSKNRSKQGINIIETIQDTKIHEALIDCLEDEDKPSKKTFCICGHLVHNQNTFIISNKKTGKQILVGIDCVEKTLDEDDKKILRKQLRECKNYINLSNKIQKQKEKKEHERKRIELLDATFRKCKKCNAQTVLKSFPDWRTLCTSCFIDDKNPLPKKCLIRLKAIKV